MISVVYCTRASKPEHKEHLIKSSGLHNKLEVIEIINNGESLTVSYNRGLQQAKNKIVVFCHDDITVETKQWGNKLLKLFNRNPQYGIIGVAGTKYLATNGKWWEDRNKMYGRVAHTHEGKTWLSEYSKDQNQELEETVVVDGVFFAIDKTKIVKTFNESVVGFHFYDVTFCFENFLSEVKNGVTTVIRINHQSIGQVNEQWEENRDKFANEFKDFLPATIKKKLRKGERLNIMLTSLSFDDSSNKSKIILDIAKRLKDLKHDVTICANMNGKLPMLAKQNGINLAPIQQPPGFALGDGKWQIPTAEGLKPSAPKTLYKVKEVKFDIIHAFDDDIIEHMNRLYNGFNIVNSRFNNGLFVSTEPNPHVKKTIEMSTDLSEIKSMDIKTIVDDYVDVI